MIWAYVILAVMVAYFARRAWRNKWRPQHRHAGGRTIGPSDLIALAQPSLWLRDTTGAGPVRLGGVPSLAPSVAWPTGPGGPLKFLLELDLAAAREASGPDWLPPTGVLQAFHGDDFGAPDLVRILHSTSAEPVDIPQTSGTPPHRFLTFVRTLSVPSLEWLDADAIAQDDDVTWDEVARKTAAPGDIKAMHKLGGYPEEIQPERMPILCELEARGGETTVTPEIESAAASWRLLLQIDSDPRAKVQWGDGGRLYIFIREEDARGGDFSRTITLYQTH